MVRTIDLNCDAGESFGAYALGNDAELFDYVTSANIACGFHAGDPATIRKTAQLAVRKNVAIGAHPSLPDLVGFGRREMQVTSQEVHDLVLYQLGALQAFVRAEGAKLTHVKPHGALYNMAARDRALAQAIAEAVRQFDPNCILVGLSGSELITVGEEAGLTTAAEAFADRNYEADGSLTPRSKPNSLLTDPELAAARVVHLLQTGKLLSRQGTGLHLRADTICVHGDSPHAVPLAKAIRQQLAAAGINVRALASR